MPPWFHCMHSINQNTISTKHWISTVVMVTNLSSWRQSWHHGNSRVSMELYNPCPKTCGISCSKTGSLQWRHSECDGVPNHRRLHCLPICWFRRRSKKTPKLHVTGICVRNSPATGEFPTQTARNAKNVSIWSRILENISWGTFQRSLFTSRIPHSSPQTYGKSHMRLKTMLWKWWL